MADREGVRRRFATGDVWFESSPLYQALARAVAADPDLIDLACEVRPGQQPPNMLFGAVHMFVLRDPELPFARFFPSVRGDEAAPPETAGAELASFCATHRGEIVDVLRSRLVQTNAPGRAAAVRYALHEVAHDVDGSVAFLEIGPSAGIQLRFDRWAVEIGGRRFGPADAQLTLRTEWRGEGRVPDLDAIPGLRERLGVDLHPIDATDPAERLWLKALVWPEHRDRLVALSAALDAVAGDPPEILAGDAIELLPRLDRERLPDDIPLVVFHSMVRTHVPDDRRPAFDAAIAALGERRPLYHVTLEVYSRERRWPLLTLTPPGGARRDLAGAQGHGRWLMPL